MEGSDSKKIKGQHSGQKNSTVSPLVPIGNPPAQTGPQNLLPSQTPRRNDVAIEQSEDIALIRNHPQPALDYHPFLQAIRPLASSGIFSPPHSLPLVTLPDHTPLSPIPHASGSQYLVGSPDSVFLPPTNIPVGQQNGNELVTKPG